MKVVISLREKRLEEIMMRCGAASLGPWEMGRGYEQLEPGYYVSSRSTQLIILAEEEGILKKGDVEFIAHAREDIPYLLDEIDKVEKRKSEFMASHHDLVMAMQRIKFICERSKSYEVSEDDIEEILTILKQSRI